MPHDINTALLRLEQNLKDLTSARTQVENAIKASNDLKEVVSQYVAYVKQLCVVLQSWESSLRERESVLASDVESAIRKIQTTASEIIETFGIKVSEQTTNFKDKTESVYQKFKDENDKLEKNVQQINELGNVIKKTTEEISKIKGTLDKISKELSESQQKQDEELREIKTKLLEIPSLIDDAVNQLIDKIDILNKNIKSFLDYSEEKFTQLNSKVDSIANDVWGVQGKCVKIQTSLDTINETIKTSNQEYLKSSKINRWILIAGFIILFILQFGTKLKNLLISIF